MSKFVNVSEEVKKLDIEFSCGELEVLTGENFSVSIEGEDTDKIIIEEQGDLLKIYDERKVTKVKTKHLFFRKSVESESCHITIKVPDGKSFDKIHLHTGAVEVRAKDLKSAILIMKMGVGDVEINSLEVTNYGKVSVGTGDVEIQSGCLNDMDMSFGVGDTDIRAKFTGATKISAGVGELSVDLQGEVSDYCVTASKGIGSVSVEGMDVSGDNTYGFGANEVNVSGGVGAINIRLV